MSFFAELKRRNVVRVGAAYVIIGWVIAQVAEFAFENFDAPPWVLKSVVVILLLGLPLVLFFSWAFEITPDGIKRENEVDRSQSITPIQSLGLFNSPFMKRQAEFLAERVGNETSDDFHEQIDRVFEVALGRRPSEIERDRLTKLAESHGLEQVCRVVLNSSEFVFLQ